MEFFKNVLGLNDNNNNNNNNNNNHNGQSEVREKREFDPTVHMAPPKEKEKVFNLLVIDSDKGKANWAELFKDVKWTFNIEGTMKDIKLKVYQGGWGDISVTCYSRGDVKRPTVAQVDLKLVQRDEMNGRAVRLFQTVSFAVDFILVRNQVVGVTPDQDFRRILFAFKFANVPSVNSIHSIYNCIERPWVFAELNRLRDQFGTEAFPLIEQNYFSTHRDMLITPSYPLAVKVGHAHAGYGKIKIEDHHSFSDFASVIALTNFYCTAEPFLNGEYDLRIQKIGNHYRAMKRIGMSGSWKTNTGAAIMEDIPFTDQYKLWVDECAKLFGGLDILAVDAIHCEDGKEFILEVNDTSIGLHPEYEAEDNGYIGDLVHERMTDYLENHLFHYF